MFEPIELEGIAKVLFILFLLGIFFSSMYLIVWTAGCDVATREKRAKKYPWLFNSPFKF